MTTRISATGYVVRYDLLVRTLKASGLKPKWVMNITDVGHLTSDADEGEDNWKRAPSGKVKLLGKWPNSTQKTLLTACKSIKLGC